MLLVLDRILPVICHNMAADPRKCHRNNDIMDHSVGSIDNDADEAVATAVEKVLSATMGATRTVNQRGCNSDSGEGTLCNNGSQEDCQPKRL